MKTALGIDISPRQVSAALVERAGREFRVVAAASSDLPDASGQQGSIELARALSCTIRRLGRRARSARARAALSLSASPLVIQILEMPKHVPANIREFVDAELKQYVSLSGRRTVSDFCGIGLAAEGRKRMLTAAVEVDQVLRAVNACAKAGVTLEAVEPSLLACARAFHAGCPGENHGRNVLISVLSDENLTTALFCNRTMDFVRIRDIPSDMRERDLLVGWLAEELKAVIRYLNAGAGVDQGTLQARVIVQSPEQSAGELEAPLRARTGVEALVVAHSCGDFPDTAAQAPSMMAVGAAMKVLSADADDLRINLLPEEVRHARSVVRHALLTAIAGALTFVGVFVVMLLLNLTADTAREQVEQTKIAEQLYTTRALIAQDKFLDQEISRIHQQVSPLQRVAQGKCEVDWPAVLNAVTRAASAGVCVTELASNRNNESISMKGLALSSEMAQSFARNLDESKPFVSASMARIAAKQQGGRNLVEYQIDCSVRATSGEK